MYRQFYTKYSQTLMFCEMRTKSFHDFFLKFSFLQPNIVDRLAPFAVLTEWEIPDVRPANSQSGSLTPVAVQYGTVNKLELVSLMLLLHYPILKRCSHPLFFSCLQSLKLDVLCLLTFFLFCCPCVQLNIKKDCAGIRCHPNLYASISRINWP